MRWILVLFAVLLWLIAIPIIELVAFGYRKLARAPFFRREDRLLAMPARPTEGPASRE